MTSPFTYECPDHSLKGTGKCPLCEEEEAERKADQLSEHARPRMFQYPLSNRKVLELAEPFGSFEFGDAQGHRRVAFAQTIMEACDQAWKESQPKTPPIPGPMDSVYLQAIEMVIHLEQLIPTAQSQDRIIANITRILQTRRDNLGANNGQFY